MYWKMNTSYILMISNKPTDTMAFPDNISVSSIPNLHEESMQAEEGLLSAK